MHIEELRACHLKIPLRKPIRHASFTRTTNDTLIVRCKLNDGTVGWGEGLPRPYVTGETIDSTFEQLNTTNLKKQLDGNFVDTNSALELLRNFELQQTRTDVRDCFGNAARCALELSVLDAATRSEGIPLSKVSELFSEAVTVCEPRTRVQYSTVLTSMSSIQSTVKAILYRLYGFAQCKIKVGTEGIDDGKLLRKSRRYLGSKMDIRIDANEAWQPEEVAQKIEPLLPCGISSLEQPVPHDEVEKLAELKPKLSVPMMLDESLCSLGDGKRAIALGLCDLFNIRLSKCGGFLNSLLLAAMAKKHGLGYQLGCQVGESGILSAAGRHFACSVGGIRFLEGSFDRYLVKEPLTEEDLTFGKGGWAKTIEKPGLGVTVDEEAMERLKIRECHWKIFG